MRRSVLQWRFIWDVSAGSTTRRSARRSRARTPSAPTSSSTPRSVRDVPASPAAPVAAAAIVGPSPHRRPEPARRAVPDRVAADVVRQALRRAVRPRGATRDGRDRARRRHDRRQGARRRRTATWSRRGHGYPLSTPRPAGRSRIRTTGCVPPSRARGGADGSTSRGSGSPGRCTGSCARRGRARDPPRDPLERPAHGGRVRRDRGARRARAADRADRQPRAHRASRRRSSSGCAATSPRPTRGSRASLLPKDYVRLRLTGRVGDRRRGRVGDAAPRRRAAALERRGARGARASRATWLPPVLESPEVGPRRDGRSCRSRPARATAAAAVGVGRSGPDTLSVVLGTSGVVLRDAPRLRPRRRARVHAFCHAVPGHVARDGRDALRRRLARTGSTSALAPTRRSTSSSPRRTAWGPGAEGLLFLPYLAGERTPHADPDARGAFAGLELRHDRGALVRAVLEGVAFGLRDSLDLLRALGVDGDAARVSGGGARGGLWLADRRVGARPPARADRRPRRARRSARRCSAASPAASSPTCDDAVARCVRVTDRVEPDPAWRDAYAELLPRYRALYPALRGLDA